MSQNYLNFKLDGTPIGLRKGQYLKEVGEVANAWIPELGFIDQKNAAKESQPYNKPEMIPEGKLLVVMAINGQFDAALCFADPWDFADHWKQERVAWRKQNDPRAYVYYLVDADKAKLMYNGGNGKDWDYMDQRKEQEAQ